MNTVDAFKQALKAAEQEHDKDIDEYILAIRKIVNVQRQNLYGDSVDNKRLSTIRNIIVESVNNLESKDED